MQEEKKSFTKRVLGFAEDKGFYIILGLCVLAIGVSGYVLFFTGDSINVPDPITLEEPVFEPTTVIPQTTRPVVTQPVTEAPQEVDVTKPPQEVAVANPVTDVVVPVTEAARPMSVPEERFVYPVSGEVIRPFSGDELAFDETMGDWRVHRGADFACQLDDEVVAMTAGTVTDVFTDPLMGHCVSITHENDLTSTYCGLTVNELVTIGQEVTAGTPIGKAGNTALAESGQPCHVHVEVARGGVFIDPLSILD